MKEKKDTLVPKTADDVNSHQHENVESNVINKSRKVKVKSKKHSIWVWPIKIFVLALALSIAFGILSEVVLNKTGLIVSIVLILLLLTVSIVFDMIGVAFTSSSVEPLYAMASRKVKGSKAAIALVKNADKVASLCCDVIGDICGILSGAAGAAIAARLIISASTSQAVLIATSVSAIIAALTVFGKAMCKNIAINKSTQIVCFVGRILNPFIKK